MEEYIHITKEPEAFGVPEQLKKQFIGLRVKVAGLPVTGWLGYDVPPALFHSCDNLPTPTLILSRKGHIVSTEGLIAACQQLNDRNGLCEWLLELRRRELHPEYFLVAHECCEYEL